MVPGNENSLDGDMAKLSADLRGGLSRLSSEQLRTIILDFAKMKKENAEWLEMRLRGRGDFPAATAYYKKKIRTALFSERINLRAARQAVLDFRRLKPETALLLDMMISYVEIGIEVENEYGDLYEAFYSSMESMYISALRLLKNNPSILPELKPRIEKIISKSAEGWGHKDTLTDYYEMLLDGTLDEKEGIDMESEKMTDG